MKKSTQETKKGFTLVEILVSTAIFLLVMTISMGAIYAVLDANKRSVAEKTAMDNLNLAVETMAREIRFGKQYHCSRGDLTNLTVPQDCLTGGNTLAFLSSDGTEVVYEQIGTQIERSSDNGATFIAVTAPEMIVQNLTFGVIGAPPNDGLQPKTFIRIFGYAENGQKADTQVNIDLQTFVSQRSLDE